MKFIGLNLVPLALIGFAALLALTDKSGYWWYIILAVFITTVPTSKKPKS